MHIKFKVTVGLWFSLSPLIKNVMVHWICIYASSWTHTFIQIHICAYTLYSFNIVDKITFLKNIFEPSWWILSPGCEYWTFELKTHLASSCLPSKLLVNSQKHNFHYVIFKREGLIFGHYVLVDTVQCHVLIVITHS